MKFNEYDYYKPSLWPTTEDTLDVNFRSIISDCRGLISGTLQPRTLGSFSGTWQGYSKTEVRMRKPDTGVRNKSKIRCSGVTKMARILYSTGKMSMEEARVKAQELLTPKE